MVKRVWAPISLTIKLLDKPDSSHSPIAKPTSSPYTAGLHSSCQPGYLPNNLARLWRSPSQLENNLVTQQSRLSVNTNSFIGVPAKPNHGQRPARMLKKKVNSLKVCKDRSQSMSYARRYFLPAADVTEKMSASSHNRRDSPSRRLIAMQY